MEDLEIGKEYLFSDDKVNWERGILNDQEVSIFQSKSGDRTEWYEHIKPLEDEKAGRKLYTQSMADNGKPIEVGMWCIDNSGCGLQCLLLPDIEGYMTFVHEGSYVFINADDINPFPDPVDLVEGEAYEFVVRGVKLKGLYDGVDTFWYFVGKYKVVDCTNIKPLTPKGE